MEYTLDRFVREVRQVIAATGRVPETLIDVTAPKPNIPADLAFPAFRAAKELGVNPVQLAKELAEAITPAADSLIGAVAATGPFLNFSLDTTKLANGVLGEIHGLGQRYGHDDLGGGATVLVEFSSPNVAKRMHVGHIRTTIIGQSLFNIQQALGYHTISDNHLGDWGKQFGITLLAIEKKVSLKAKAKLRLPSSKRCIRSIVRWLPTIQPSTRLRGCGRYGLNRATNRPASCGSGVLPTQWAISRRSTNGWASTSTPFTARVSSRIKCSR